MDTIQYHINSGYLTGQDICALMRRNKVTIRALANYMGITQKRVRYVRSNGIRGRNWVRDWTEAITTKQ